MSTVPEGMMEPQEMFDGSLFDSGSTNIPAPYMDAHTQAEGASPDGKTQAWMGGDSEAGGGAQDAVGGPSSQEGFAQEGGQPHQSEQQQQQQQEASGAS